MKDKKTNRYWFWRSVKITAIVLSCAVTCFLGIASAWEGIVKTGYAKEKQAIEYNDGRLSLFGYEIKII